LGIIFGIDSGGRLDEVAGNATLLAPVGGIQIHNRDIIPLLLIFSELIGQISYLLRLNIDLGEHFPWPLVLILATQRMLRLVSLLLFGPLHGLRLLQLLEVDVGGRWTQHRYTLEHGGLWRLEFWM
jgi:hypothetical protein